MDAFVGNSGRFGRSRSRDFTNSTTESSKEDVVCWEISGVFRLSEDTQEGLVGLCEAGCRALSVSAAPALGREFYA